MSFKTILFALICLGLSVALQAQDYGIISAKDVNMRRSANTSAELITKLDQYSLVQVLETQDRPQALGVKPNPPSEARCNEFYWHRVRYNGQEGWVYGAFLFVVSKEKVEASQLYQFQPSKDATDKGYFVLAYRAHSGADMCVGDQLAFVLPPNYKSNRQASAQPLIFSSGNNSIGSLNFLGFMYEVFTVFIDPQGRLVLAGGYYNSIGDASGIQVVEFTWDASQQAWRGKAVLSRSNQ